MLPIVKQGENSIYATGCSILKGTFILTGTSLELANSPSRQQAYQKLSPKMLKHLNRRRCRAWELQLKE